MQMNHRPSLLLVDDDVAVCESLQRDLHARGFDVRIALSARDAAARVHERPPHLAVLGVKLADGSEQELIATLLRTDPRTRIVVVTDYGTLPGALEVVHQGSADYFAGPPNGNGAAKTPEADGGANGSTPDENPMSLQRVAWEHIESVLRQHKGNISATARALSLHRRTLQRKLNKRPVRK
jgi:two-component system response regulator RegA